VARPIIVNVITSVVFRPLRSPMWPKTSPPTGRATNPTANEANAASVPANSEKVGKNSRPNTSADAVPKMKKSYHSMEVPTMLAMATRRTDSGAEPPWVV
jgi:hypothetical protein